MSKTFKIRATRQQRIMRWISGFALIAGVCLIVFGGGVASLAAPDTIVAAIAGGAMLGAVATEEEFRKKVLEGVDAIRGKVDEIDPKVNDVAAKYDNLDKKTKDAFEELTKVKNTANESHEKLMTALQKVNTQLTNERRMAFGDPVKRIQADEKMRLGFNLAVRQACRVAGCDDAIATLQKALGTGATPGSTYVVTDELAREIYDALERYGVWNTFAVRRVGVSTTRFPITTARPVMLWIDEAGQISPDATKAGTSVNLLIKKGAVLLYVSRELLQDSSFDVTAMVLDDFGQAAAYRLDHAALIADGTADATHGAFSGIFVAGTMATAAAGNVTVEQTELEDWQKCLLTVDAAVLNRPANWYLHPQILIRTLSIKDANGRPLFQTALEAPTPRGIGSILGYPLILASAAPTTNAANAKVAAFGESNANVVGIRQDFQFDSSEHHRFDYDQVAYRGIIRAGTKLRSATAFAVLKLPAA